MGARVSGYVMTADKIEGVACSWKVADVSAEAGRHALIPSAIQAHVPQQSNF